MIRSSTSDFQNIKYSVPQDSILGPTLFTCHLSTLLSILPYSNNLQLSAYADDHSLIPGFTPGEDTLVTTKQLLKTSLNIKDWTHMNHLKMNESITQFIVFGKGPL